MHNGVWDKSAKGSFEVRGKKLGLIGYGNIGTQLSVIAESLGMKVLYYDAEERLSLGNAIKCKTMKEVLEQADVISMHVDGRKIQRQPYRPERIRHDEERRDLHQPESRTRCRHSGTARKCAEWKSCRLRD